MEMNAIIFNGIKKGDNVILCHKGWGANDIYYTRDIINKVNKCSFGVSYATADVFSLTSGKVTKHNDTSCHYNTTINFSIKERYAIPYTDELWKKIDNEQKSRKEKQKLYSNLSYWTDLSAFTEKEQIEISKLKSLLHIDLLEPIPLYNAL